MDIDAMLESFFAALKEVLKSASDARERRAPQLPLKRDVAPRTPAQLNEEMGVSLGTGEVPGADFGELLRLLQLSLRHSVNTNSPLFLNRLYSGAELAGVLAEYLVVAMNTSAGAWDVSPVFSLMEREVVNRFLFHVGFPGGCGVFCPGGSTANLYGMHVARERALAHGHKLSKLVAVCGTQAHYSVDKSARLIGLEYWQLVKVASDCNGRVVAADLERALREIVAEGNVPFFCHLTSGTTVMGAFDELAPLAAVCRRVSPEVWVHVDACWGGSVLLSDEHKQLMAGVEQSDSVAWCAHKMMGAPLHASVALFRSGDALRAGFDCNTPYIYQRDASASEESFQLDLMGKHTFQCSRPADSVKVWFVWRHLGSAGLAEKVNHVYAMARHLVELIESPQFSRNFRLVHNAPQFTNVCFWFLPDKLVDAFATDFEEREGRLFGPKSPDHFVGSVTAAVRAEMLNRGQLQMGYSTLSIQGWAMPNFFRFVAVGRQIAPEHLLFALEHLREIGNQLYK